MTWGSLNPFVSASRRPLPPTAVVLEDAASLKSSQSLDFDSSKVYKFQIDANDSNGDWDYNYDLREIGGSGSGSVLSSFSNSKSEEMKNPTIATTATKNESNTTGTTTSSFASWAKKRKSFLLSHEQELKTAVLSSWERRQQEAEQQQQQLQQLDEFRRKNSLPMVSTSTSSSSISPSLLNDKNHDNGSLMSYSSSKSSSSAALSSSVLSFPKFSVSNIKNSIQSGSKPQADDFFQEMKSWNKKFKLRKINNTRTTEEREGGTATSDVKIISSIDGTRTIEERGCMIQDMIGIVDDEIKNEINNAISYGITDSDNDNSDSNSETDTNEDNSNDNTVDETSDASKVAIADEKPVEVPLDALSPQGEEKTKHKKLWKKIKLFHKIGGTFKKRSRKQRPSATVASSSTEIPSTSTTTTNNDAVIHSTVAALVDSDYVTKEAQQSPQQSEQHQQQKIFDVVLEEEEKEVGAVNEIISVVDSKCDTNNNTDELNSIIDTIKNSPRNISTAVNAMMSSTTRNSIESISNILIPNFISDEIVKVFSSGDDASRDLLSDSSDHAIVQGKTDYYGIVNDHINDDGGNNIAADENVELSIWEADPVVGQLAKMSILLDGGTRRQEVIEHGSHRQRRILRLVDEYPPNTDTTTTTTSSSSTGKNIVETESKSTSSSSDNVITHTEQYDVGTRSVKEIARKDGSKTVITTIEASEDGVNSNNGVKEEERNDRGDCVVEEDCREKDNELRDIITVSAIGIEIEESDGSSNTLGMSQSSTQRPIKIPEITFEDRVSSFLALSATAVTCSNLHSTEQRNIDDVIDNKENKESSNLSCTDSENSSMSKLVSTNKNLATISGSSNNSTCSSTARGSGGSSQKMTSTTSQQPPPSCSGDSNEKAALTGLRSIPSRVDKEETRELPPAAAATYNKNNDDNNNANNTIHKQHIIKVDNNQKLSAATSTDPSEVICSMNDDNSNNNNKNNAAAATTTSTSSSSSTSQEKATTLFKKKQRVKEKIETKSGNKKPKERKGKQSVTSSDNHRLPSKKKQSSTTLLFDFDDIRHDYQSRTPEEKRYKERQAELATNLFGNKKKERTKLTTTKQQQQQQQQKEHSKTRRNNIKKKKATAVPAFE